MTKRCVIYIRISDSDDRSTSLARQEEDLRRKAKDEDWTVLEPILSDDGYTGTKSRLKADQALDMLRDGRADVLLTWKWDRYSRVGLPAVADLIKVLDKRPGTLFVAAMDSLRSDSPAWAISAVVLAEIAKQESANTKLRVTSSVNTLRKTGRFSGGMVPFGFKSITNDNRTGQILVIDDHEASVLKEAADAVIDGKALTAIAADFNKRGLRTKPIVVKKATATDDAITKPGSLWTYRTLQRMLTSDSIQGFVVHHGDVLRDKETGKPSVIWPAILEPNKAKTVRDILISAEPGVKNRRQDARLLSGLIFCGHCGSSMYPWNSTKGKCSYTCSAREKGCECVGVSITAASLEAFIESQFLARFGRFETMTAIESPAYAAEIAEVGRSLATTHAQMDNDDNSEEEDEALNQRLRLLKARRAELKKMVKPTVYVGTGVTFVESWNSERSNRRRLLANNLNKVSIKKGKRGKHGLDTERVDISWKRRLLTVESSVDVNDMPSRIGQPIKKVMSGPKPKASSATEGTFQKSG